MIVGSSLFGVGIVISFTGIGACLGIPMVIIGLPMIIVGAIMYSRARSARADAVIASSISEAVSRNVQSGQLAPKAWCTSCGSPIDSTGPYCSRCGAAVKRNA
jgi:hypothetical protein